MHYRFPRLPRTCARCARDFDVAEELVSAIFAAAISEEGGADDAGTNEEADARKDEPQENGGAGEGSSQAADGEAAEAASQAADAASTKSQATQKAEKSPKSGESSKSENSPKAGEAEKSKAPTGLPGDDVLAFLRRDFCLVCAEGQTEEAFSVWRTHMPSPQDKEQAVRLDPRVVFDFFQRLAERREPGEEGYLYFLALYLMRKRVLKFLDTVHRDEGEVWLLESRPDGDRYEVLDPGLDPEALEEIREQVMDALSAQEMEL